MKNITISYDFLKEIGGLERVMFFQANKLSEKYKVNLIFGHIDKKEELKIVQELGLVETIPRKSFNKKNEIINLGRLFLFPSSINKVKANLVISHSFMCSRAAYFEKKKNKTPYVVVVNHPPNFLYNSNLKWANSISRKFAFLLGLVAKPLLKKIDKKVVQNADLVIANSNYTAQRVKEIYNLKPEILTPVLTNEFKVISKDESKEILKKFGLKNKFILLHGRIIRDKRPDLAIKSFSILSRKMKEVDLVISGTIEEEEKLKKIIKELNIENKVHILGKVSKQDLVNLYNSAECFLMSAPKEDFGLTPIEAMACGTPVVAWKDGAGPEETIIDGKTGLLAKPYSIEDYAKKIEICLDKKWNKEMISKSVEKYSEENIKNRFFEIVERII
jgi:glycosyltransferase involved in cell wall biosynthesis